jgi:integrase
MGKREKKWKGFFYVYSRDAEGNESARHRSVILGSRSEIRSKHEAEQRLQEVIERETQQLEQPGFIRRDVTLGRFAAEVFVPLRRSGWRKDVTASVNLSVLERHVLPALGPFKLSEVTPLMIQQMLDEKAAAKVPVFKHGKETGEVGGETYSKSLVRRMYVLTRAMFQEAVEQDYLRKNPAKRCRMPETREESRPVLSPAEVARLLGVLGTRDRLIVRLLSICALRAGEIFELRWDDWDPLRSDRSGGTLSIRRQITGRLKTPGSKAKVALTEALDEELTKWFGLSFDIAQNSLIFPSEVGTPIAPGNWLKRVLKPAAAKVGINHVTHHMFRRTYPTIGQHGGSVKDLQAQLRHASPDMTAEVYMQAVAPSVRAAAEYVEQKINGAEAEERAENSFPSLSITSFSADVRK